MPRALITGISGFAGTHLAEHLLALGDEVAGLTRAHDPLPEIESLAGRVKVHAADVAEPDAVADVLAQAAPDHVYHLAGFSSPRLSLEDPLACYRANVLGTAALLEAIRRTGARPRVLCVSSAEVYGRAERTPIPEDAPLRPITPYGASKAAAEMVAVAAFETSRIPTIRVRAFNHVGPRQEAVFATPAFAKQVAEAEAGLGPATIRVGNLAPVRDLSDARDVVRAYRALVERGTPGEVYNVATGRGVTMRAVLERLIALARVPLMVAEDPALFRAAEIEKLIGDATRLERATGVRLDRPLDESLAALLDYWRARTRG